MIGPEDLGPRDWAALRAEIARARRTQPEAFAQVAAVRKNVARLDQRKRGAVAPISPLLKAIGPTALWPMLEMLAVQAAPRGELNASAWLALRLGLVEAVGTIRDARARPVLAALWLAPETLLVRAVAEALGRLGDDASVALLLDRAGREQGARRMAVYSGMGSCRRLRSTQALAKVLAAEEDPERAKVLVKALAEAGNSGAWRTSGAWAKGEEQAVRETSARALVAAFVKHGGDVRQAASNGLLVVDAPATPGLIAQARARASGLVVEALDALRDRFARNPVRLAR
ncbi:MAG: HEAT repeat domain-containing protein [Deltaproteobacteria bacterium]|nr:HEAT repeat domain-containing protein [Deltaproteobacteria bacterium]